MPEEKAITVDILPRIDYAESEPVQAFARTVESAVTLQEGVLRGFAVQSDEDFRKAGEGIVQIGDLEKRIEERRRAITRPIDEAKRATMDLFRQPLVRLKELKDHLSRGMRDWDRKKRTEAEAERQRLEAEAAKRAEEERERLFEVLAAIDAGEETKAEKLMEAPVVVREKNLARPTVSPPRAAGVVMREYWTFEIVNADQIPREYMVPDTRALQSLATGQKHRAAVPGVRFYSERSPARTGR